MRQGTLQRGRREDRGIWVYIFPDPTCKDFEYLCAFIFVDEIDTILSLSFPVNDFFGFIRYCHELRQNHATYQRLTWALFSVATPSDLIRDRTRTPFNIGQAIDLNDFHLEEAYPLLRYFPDYLPNPQGILKVILHWSGGQPLLTQKLCQRVVELSTIATVRLCLRLG